MHLFITDKMLSRSKYSTLLHYIIIVHTVHLFILYLLSALALRKPKKLTILLNTMVLKEV